MSNFVIMALGSNLGNCLKNISDAYLGIFDFLNIRSVSPIYSSKALLPEGAPKEWDLDYYNSVICGVTELSVHELHKRTKELEEELGKDHNLAGKWAPRTMDIDIIAFNNEIISEENLKIPHPRMLQRDFVMLPLVDILPNWQHPRRKETSSELLKKLPQIEAKKIELNSKTKLMGILNLTPDSFSDGGKYITEEGALKRINEMISEGVDIIDIGAESTRPNAEIISLEEEWKRLEPILKNIKKIKEKSNCQFSLDSRNPETQQKALDYGVDIINDVSGFSDERMIELAKLSGVKVIFMHSLTIPANKKIVIDESKDPVKVLKDWAKDKISELESKGIDKTKMIFDPGLGFGKTAKQSWEIVKRVDEFKALEVEILIGHSEKSFLSLFTDKPAGQRGFETLAISAILLHKNIDYLRVHDVAPHRKLLDVYK